MYDIKPPANVLAGFLDSIKLVFALQSLLPVDPVLPDHGPYHDKNAWNRKKAYYQLQSYSSKDNSASSVLSNRTTANLEEYGDEDILFRSPYTGTQVVSIEMMDRNEEGPDILLFSVSEIMSINPYISTPPAAHEHAIPLDSAKAQIPSPLDLFKLIDASLRHTISGTLPPTRGAQNSGQHGIKLTTSSSNLSLGEISPALFRPGYMQVL